MMRRMDTTEHDAVRGRTTLLQAAVDAGWEPSAADSAFLLAVGSAVGLEGEPRVAVLVAEGSGPELLSEVLRSACPHARINRVEMWGGWSRAHVALVAGGPYDVVVADLRHGAGCANLFRRTFWYLRDGGRYVVRDCAVDTSETGGVVEPGRESVTSLLARLEAAPTGAPTPQGYAERDDRALGGCVAGAATRADHLVVTKVGRSYAKLTEEEANRLLPVLGPGTGTSLRRGKPVTWSSRCVLRESPSSRNGEWPDHFTAPALYLREYADVVCSPGQVVLKDHLLLPDTYRHIHRARLGNRWTTELGPRFAVPTDDVRPQEELAGSYFHLDNEFRGHFGHAVTDQLSRVWAWPEAKRAHPDLRVLLAINTDRPDLAPFELVWLAAAGIAEEDVVLTTGPVRVERLLGATPMLSNPAYVHPDIEEVWERVGSRLAASAPDRSYPERIFCSRREQDRPGVFPGTRRACRNSAELEAWFAARGFTTVYPEEFSLAEQVQMFRGAEVVAGYAGSAMFNLLFSVTPKHVVLVSAEGYVARNEYLIASVLGHRLDVAWCRPDRGADDLYGPLARNSSFAFDFEREGRFLAEVLDA
jgi:capsular polysaccharide biosynthesis protein